MSDRGSGEMDEVMFSWADAENGLQGLVRVVTGAGASSLGVALAGGEPLSAPGPVELAEAEPHRRWSARGDGFALEFEASTPLAELPAKHAVAKAGGMEGHVQLCRVHGTVGERAVSGLGQRAHAWGRPNWGKIELRRRVGAWLDDGTGVVIYSVRPAGAQSHAEEAIWAAALDAERVRKVDDPRLSSTTDASGRLIRAGLELWIEEDDEYPFRGLGEPVGGVDLQVGGLRLACRFFRWHIDGRAAIGRYDVLRPA